MSANGASGLVVSPPGPSRSAPHQWAEPGRLNAVAPTSLSETGPHVSNGHHHGQSHHDEDDPKEEELVRMHGTSPLISSDIPAAWTVLVGGICHNSIMDLTRPLEGKLGKLEAVKGNLYAQPRSRRDRSAPLRLGSNASAGDSLWARECHQPLTPCEARSC